MLKINIWRTEKIAVLVCQGRIVAETASRLDGVVRAELPAEMVLLDLAGVADVDAAGLGALVDLHNLLRRAESRLRLLNLRPVVEKMLVLTGLDSVLETCSLRQIFEVFCESAASATLSPARTAEAIVPA